MKRQNTAILGSFFRMVRTGILTAIATLSLGSYGSAAVINGVEFTTVYDGSALPASPWASLPGPQTGSATIVDGALKLNTAASQTRYYQIAYNSANPIWDGSIAADTPGTTIEFRLKVESVTSDATNAAVIYFSTGTKGYSFYFKSDEIRASSATTGAVQALDTSVFHTYRITLSGNEGGVANFYIDGVYISSLSGISGVGSITTNHIYFGDPSGNTGGVTYWDYMAFTNAGAFAPIPEPATAMLLLGGMAGVFFIARRREA